MERFTGFPPGYRIEKVNPMVEYGGWGGAGPKPTGMIAAGGALYLAWQNLKGFKQPVRGLKSQHGSDSVITCSRDGGLTWKPDIKDLGWGTPTFEGPRFGGPAFINFGRGNDGARDDFVYAISSDQWDNGGHLILGRAPNDRITEGSAWEWVSGVDEANVPTWTNRLELAQAVLSDDCWLSAPEMVYLAAIGRYLLLTWHLNADFSPDQGSQLVIYDAPEPWGPFTLAHYEPAWESTAMNPYCPRLPLKWMEADGVTGWLQFSGSWAKGSPHYRSHVRRFRLVMR